MVVIFLKLTMNVALKSFNVELAEDKDNLVQDQAVKLLDLDIFNNADDWSLDGVKLSSLEELKLELQKRAGNDDDIKINILSDKSVPASKVVRLS